MEENQNKENNSILNSIINTPSVNQELPQEINNNLNNNTNIPDTNTSQNSQTPPTKKEVKKRSFADVIRIFSSIGLASMILFGTFLGYVVFNPDQAKFFISLGIDPKDIKSLLEKLVNAIFGILTFSLIVISLIFLFRAFFTKKEFAKKKTISTILSIFFILLLFTNITIWAWLFTIIGATDFINPNGGVIIYDVDKKNSTKFKDGGYEITNFDNLIGPLNIQFDLSADARYVSKYIKITGYNIDFDGDGKIDKQGINAETDKDIIFNYSIKGSFASKGVYVGKDKVTGKTQEVDMKLPVITIVGITKVQENPDRMGGKRVIIDLSDIKNLGKIDFYLEGKNGEFGDTPDNTYDGGDKYSPTKTFKNESLICLALSSNTEAASNCNKIFIVGSVNTDLGVEIVEERDPINPLTYNLTANISNKDVVIQNYDWIIDGGDKPSNEQSFEYSFHDYGKHEIKLNLTLGNGNITTVLKEINITKPLTLTKPLSDNSSTPSNSLLRITDEDGKSVIDGTYDRNLGYYNLKFPTPFKLNLDASYVRTQELSYELSKVEWDLNNDGKFEKTGEKIDYSFVESKKYLITARYSFTSKIKKDTQTIDEKILVEGQKKDIDIVLNITQDSDYAPTMVHFDGSATEAKVGKITKFTYDFGEGRASVDGDAKQDYKYRYPGEFIVTFTATKEDGTKESVKKKIILKEQQKEITINSSVSSGLIGKNIDFDAVGSNGIIDTYAWDFDDGSTSSDTNPTHSFKEAGTYKVKLTVSYTDGIVKTGYKEITIK